MPVTRRKLFSMRATVGYALFAAAWILLSDRVLEMFADPHAVARLSTYKGLAFIAVTSAMLWLTLQNTPSDTDTYLGDTNAPRITLVQLAWGLLTPGVATAVEWIGWEQITPYVWILYYPAVFIAAWLGGAPAGLLATVISTLAGWYLLIPPRMSWQIDKPASVIAICIFFAANLLVSLVMGWMRRGEQNSDNNKFQALVEQSLAGIFIVQGDRFRYVNPAFALMLGYDDPEQLIHKIAVSSVVSPVDRERIAPYMHGQANGDMREVRYSFTGVRRDGTAVALDVHGRELQTTSGRVIIGLVLDVTERRRTEAALRQSEALLRAVVEGTTDAIFVKDLDGRYLMANPASATMAGITVEQIVGQDDSALFDPASAERIRQADRTVMQADTTSTHEEALTFHNGEHRIFLVTKGPIKDDKGQSIGLFGLSRDITERVEAQNTLREKQALLDDMSRLAKVGGWSLDVATGHGTRTDGAARILDLDPTQPGSLAFYLDDGMDYFRGEHRDKLSATIRRAIDHGEAYALELELITAKGTIKWIRTLGNPIWQDGRVVRIEGAIQDISEVQQAREALQMQQASLEQTVQERTAELEAARQEAERLARIKSEFLANMSHEIRTPLNGVLGLAQIGSRDHTGSAHHIFEQINASGRLLLGIINDILDFSKIEAGKLHIETQPVALRPLLARAVDLVRDQAQEKGLALQTEVDADLPTHCMGDALRLEQIMLNLLSNAVKFTASGAVHVSARPREDKLVLTVADTGIGMTVSQVDSLFRPFEQADGSTTRQFGGTGLGLAITKRLVEMLGGEIQVFSAPDRGTRFEVILPLVQGHMPSSVAPTTPAATEASPPTAEAVDAPPARAPRLHGLRILAAEDNQVNQMVLAELLSYEGAEVTMSDNGVSVMAKLAQHGAEAFDLVLMDIQMPVMDGYEATRRIQALAPSLPVIGQTAHAMSEEHAKCRAAGMVDLVVKPIELEALVSTIRRHVPQTSTV